MSQQIFLTEDEIVQLFLSEVPQGVYPTDQANDPDPTKRSVSSSEIRAFARLLAQAYSNLSDINNAKFVSTLESSDLVFYENDYFASAQDSTQPLAVRQAALIAKLRSNGGISYPAIKAVIAGILGSGVAFDLLPRSGQQGGAWLFSVSLLGVNTYLSELDPIIGARTEGGLVPLDCSQNYAAAGLTAAQFAAIQRSAYLYDVRIYSNVSQATINLLDSTLTTLEPARSSHVIYNNYPAPSYDYSAYVASTSDFQRFRL